MKSSSIEELSESLGRLLDDAEQLLRGTAANAGEKADRAAGQTRDTLHRVCEHLRSAREEATSRAHTLDRTVRAHPWQALAMTGFVAFLAGLLVRRR